MSQQDRLQHMLVLGKTGRGKTTLLENIIVQDIYAGRGVGVIDPHSDLSRSPAPDNSPTNHAATPPALRSSPPHSCKIREVRDGKFS
jgi:DNA helicase HerA-like ATPase